MKASHLVVGLGALAAAAAAAAPASAATLDTVKSRGQLVCGVNNSLPGFSAPDEKGQWSGIDVDYCKALAAVVLGDASKVKYVPLTAKERLTALQTGEIDVLARNTTWTMSRDTGLGLSFVGVNYYDGQGFMVKTSLGVKSAKELNGASVCVQAGTTTELNLADYFRANNMKYQSVVFDTSDQTLTGFESDRCDVLTSDQSQLYGLRSKLPDPSKAGVLPEVISKEPLGPVVRQGDDQWFNIARWTLYAMLNLEEAGVTSKNVDEMLKTANPDIKRLLGVEGDFGSKMGVTNDFAVKIVKAVGNYGESFEKTVGQGSPLKIARGLNALWTNGGIQYAPPVR